MATRPLSREDAKKAILEERSKYSQLLKQAQASGDKEAYQRYSDQISKLDTQLRGTSFLGDVGGGIASAGVGLLTGLPDIVISGYNAAANPTVPMKTLRERALEFGGIPTQSTSEEGSIAYGTPEVATAVVGLGQLANLGYQGTKAWLKSRKVDGLLSKLDPADANRFKGYMLKGQGSPNAEVSAKIAELRNNPKYTEIFNTLDDAATKAALANMAPRPSRMEEPSAATRMAETVESKLKSLRDARTEAGNTNFTKAFEQGGDRNILNTDTLLEKVRGMKKEFSSQNSDSSKAAVKWLQSIEDDLVPKFNVPARAGTSYTSPTAARDTLTNAPIPGQDVTYNIPGSQAYTVTQAPRKLTVQETQAKLKEWGRSAKAEDQVVRDLAISDEQRISSTLFGAVKDDLEASLKAASNVADKKALGYLNSAREQTSQASKAYNDVVAQGMPSAFKNKAANEVDFETMAAEYKNLNPAQRTVFREWIGENNKEALQAIDRDVFQAFKAKHTGTLADGTVGTDLKSMAQDWAIMAPKEQDALAKALGTNRNEFNGRMKDALVFTRRLQTGGTGAEEAATKGLTREVSAIVGSTPAGYQGAKITQLLGDIFGGARKGVVSDDLAMKTLLSPEGAQFLKTAKMSPGSQETLKALTAMDTAAPARMQYLMPTNAVVSPMTPTTETTPVAAPQEDVFIPSFEEQPATPAMEAAPAASGEVFIPSFNEQ